MAESVVLTKSANLDYQLVIGGNLAETIQFPRADYSTTALGVKLTPYLGRELMKKHYPPEAWTVGIVTGFTTNKEVTDAITALENE